MEDVPQVQGYGFQLTLKHFTLFYKGMTGPKYKADPLNTVLS